MQVGRHSRLFSVNFGLINQKEKKMYSKEVHAYICKEIHKYICIEIRMYIFIYVYVRHGRQIPKQVKFLKEIHTYVQRYTRMYTYVYMYIYIYI